MRLSEAIMLGSTTVQMVATDWNSCALGAAANAIGLPKQITHFKKVNNHIQPETLNPRNIAIRKVWPWLGENSSPINLVQFEDTTLHIVRTTWMVQIWARFDYGVVEGKMTLEELVDYVRSVEPDCDQCNQFVCSCKKDPTTVEEKEIYAVK